MITTQYINLNMKPSGVLPVLYCSQYDIGRPLGLVVYNDSEPVDLDTYTCTIEATRTDGTAITSAVVTDDNIGAFVTTATMTNQADRYLAKLVLFDSNSRRVASLAFVMCITAATMDENAESIQEDESLYVQYTGTVQTIIAEIRSDLSAETTRAQAAEGTLQSNINAETTARTNAVNAEATARQNADNTLQSNINTEAGTRATADASLQSQIDQIIAPSGDAPSAAEVLNARIGADGITYPTLGDAIRTNDQKLQDAIDLQIPYIQNINTTSMPNFGHYITEANVWEDTSGTLSTVVVPIPEGYKKIEFTSNTQGGVIAFLSSLDTDSTPQFSESYPARMTLAGGVHFSYDLEPDMKYFYFVRRNFSSVVLTPSKTQFISVVSNESNLFPYGVQPSQMSIFKQTANMFSDFCYHITEGYYTATVSPPGKVRITSTPNWQGWLIRVKPNTTYTIGPVDYRLYFFDADLIYDSRIQDNLSDSAPNTFTTGANVFWMSLTQLIAHDMSDWMMVEGDTYPTEYISGYPLWVAEPRTTDTNKTIAYMGDSITAGVGTTKCYHQYIHEKYGFICLNYGFGGAGYYHNSASTSSGRIGMGVPGRGEATTPENFFTPNNVLARLSELNPATVDGIVIFAGTNDYGNNVSIADYTTAIDNAFEYCLTNLPTAPVLVITPIHRKNGSTPNSEGKTLRDYVDALIEECRKYGIAYVDAMTFSGIYPDNAANLAAYFTVDSTGLHPDQTGHKRIASIVSEPLKAINSYTDF